MSLEEHDEERKEKKSRKIYLREMGAIKKIINSLQGTVSGL